MTTKFVLTIGLFDKDSKKLEIMPADAQRLVNDEVAKRFEGATVFSADGVYRHYDGSTVREPSIRVEVVAFDHPDKVYKSVADFALWAKDALNQESILFEEIHERCEFL